MLWQEHLKLIIAIMTAIPALYINGYFRIAIRRYREDGKVYRAIHVTLPGFERIEEPESRVRLEKLVGSRKAELVIGAAKQLQKTNHFREYELRQEKDGSYFLYRPPRRKLRFSLCDWQQVSPGWTEKAVK